MRIEAKKKGIFSSDLIAFKDIPLEECYKNNCFFYFLEQNLKNIKFYFLKNIKNLRWLENKRNI